MTSTPRSALPLRLRIRRRGRAVRRLVLARRRLLAALLVGLAAAAGLLAVAPAPSQTRAVLVAAHALEPGRAMRAEDVSLTSVPVDTPPGAAALTEVQQVAGRVLAGPVEAGEVLTSSRMVGSALAAGVPGRVSLPVRLPDAGTVALLRVGDRIDLFSADLQGGNEGAAVPVAEAVDVLAVPSTDPVDNRGSSASGGPGAVGLSGRVVVVAVSPQEVTAVTQASVGGFVTFAWSPL